MEPRPLPRQQFATSENDVTRTQLGELLVPSDSVLAKRGGTYAIYDALLTDDQVKSTFSQRRSAVTSCPWEVIPFSESAADKSAADFIRDQIDELDWEDIVEKKLYGVFYGFSVAELLYEVDGAQIVLDDIKVRDRVRFRYDRAGQLRLITQHQPYGVVMDDRYFWHYQTGASHSDDPYGLGLAHFLYWPVFFKRTDMKFWLQFLEKFSSPSVLGKMPRGQMANSTAVTAALDALEKLRQDAVSVIPDDLVVELLEATRSGTVDYGEFDKRMDMRIAKVVLSQTLTTEAVGGQYKGEVHKEVRDEVVQADARLITSSFKDQVVKRLVEWNFPAAEVPEIKCNTDPEEDLTERAERDTKIFALGYEPTDDYIADTYGDGWQKKAAPEALGLGAPPDPNLDPEAAAAFSELVGTLSQAKRARQADQTEIHRAAMKFAEQSPEVLGDRVRQLLNALDETGDLVAFRELLGQYVIEGPQPQTVEAVKRANIISRILGGFRAQRA